MTDGISDVYQKPKMWICYKCRKNNMVFSQWKGWICSGGCDTVIKNE